MKVPFTVFVVCATVVQLSLAAQSSDTSQDQVEAIYNIALVNSYRDTAILQAEKVSLSFFSTAFQNRLLNNTGEDNSFTKETCSDGISTLMMAVFNTILNGIFIVDPEASTTAESYQSSAANTITDLSDDICSALNFLLRENPPAKEAEIQTLQDKQVSRAKKLYEIFHTIIRNNRTVQPSIEIAFENAESKSRDQYTYAINATFMTIKELTSYRPDANRKDILSLIKTTQNQIRCGFEAAIETLFGLVQSMATASYVIEFGVTSDSSTIQAIESSASSNFDKACSCQPETPTEEEPSTDTCDQDGTAKGTCDSEIAREDGSSQAQKGLAAIFNTMQILLAQAPPKNQTVSENDTCDSASARNKTASAYMAAINAAFYGATFISSGSCSVVESAQEGAGAALNKAVGLVYDTIDSIHSSDSSSCLTDFQAMEDAAVSAASAMVEDLYRGIVGNQTIDADLKASVEYSMQDSITYVKQSYQSIFTIIEIKMAETSSDDEYGSEGNKLSVKVSQTEAILSIKAVVGNMFDMIEFFLKTSDDKKLDRNSDLAAVRFQRKIAMYKVEEGVKLFVTNIMKKCLEVSTTNQNMPRNDAQSIIEAGRAETSAAYMRLVQNIFCVFPQTNSKSFATIKKRSFIVIQAAVDYVYLGISYTQANNYTKNQIAAIGQDGTSNFAQLIVYIYDAIRLLPNYTAATETELESRMRKSISDSNRASRDISEGVKNLHYGTSSESQAAREDAASLITANFQDGSTTLAYLIPQLFMSIETYL